MQTYGVNNIRIGEVLIGDESGTIKLRLVKEQLEGLKEGMTIEVRNCKVNVVNERMRLEIDPWGKLVLDTQMRVGEVNTTNNKSDLIFRVSDEPMSENEK